MLDSNERKFDRLRELAENLLKKNDPSYDDSGDEIKSLLHELRVYQVELNLQNEELQRTQEELAVSKQEYTDLFDYAPVAYLIIDREGIIHQASLTAVAKFGTTRQALYGKPFSYLVARADRDKYYLFHRAVLNELRPHSLELWFGSDHFDSFYGRVESVAVDEDNNARMFRIAITDITERKTYEERLEVIHLLDQAILQKLPLPHIIEKVINQLWEMVGATYIAVMLFENIDGQMHYFIRDQNNETSQHRGQLTQVKSATLSDDALAAWQDGAVKIMKNPTFLSQNTGGRYPVHLFAPITNENKLSGLIDLGAKWADDFRQVPTEFIQQLALHLGIAIQQAEFLEQIEQHTSDLERLVEERTEQLHESQRKEHEQRLFAEGLLAIVTKINLSLELEEVLEQILANLENVTHYDGAQIIIMDAAIDTRLVRHGGSLQLNELSFTETSPILSTMERTREPLLLHEGAYRFLPESEVASGKIESYLGVPIQSGDQLLGFINLYALKPGTFNYTDTRHLQAFAEQASIAVKNAHLYHKGQELAALEERQRLARDLHDAVSQLIFSLSIMAESLPKVLEHQRYEKVKDLSESIRIAASAVHAEMRLLLLELRPMSFERMQLHELLHNLVNAFLGQHSTLYIHLEAEQTPPLSIEVKNNLYRIAQEALNNIRKHADAHNISIRLSVNEANVILAVEDDGKGFSMTIASSGHGLKIMQERAESIGAVFTLNSQIGSGTQLRITYSMK